jgi:hypothetical protein
MNKSKTSLLNMGAEAEEEGAIERKTQKLWTE